MKLADSRLLDALCGEYLLGTLQGRARSRFERALREEPRVASRLQHWQRAFAPRYAQDVELQPASRVWKRLERELELARYRTPWWRRLGFWRGFAAAATIAAALAIGIPMMQPVVVERVLQPIAQLEGAARVTASISADRRTLQLNAARPLIAGPAQSYELWLLPAEGGPPISLAVLGNVDARFAVPPAHVKRLVPGAKLAITVEPAGGSPTGAPTSAPIVAGQITG